MTTFEQTLPGEVATLPESRQADVLAFIRFLKISLPEKEKIKADLNDALKDARETAKRLNISQEDIDAEIRAVLEEK